MDMMFGDMHEVDDLKQDMYSTLLQHNDAKQCSFESRHIETD